MSPILPAWVQVYDDLLKLYPQAFYAEYGEEMNIVFQLTVQETLPRGRWAVLQLVTRELQDLPGGAIQAHRRYRSTPAMIQSTLSRFKFSPGSRSEIIAALALFIVFGAIPNAIGLLRTGLDLPPWLRGALNIALLVTFLFVLVVGLFNRLPRWFLPYLGVPVPILIAGLIPPDFYPDILREIYRKSWFIGQIAYQAEIWGTLALMLVLFLLITRLVPRLHKLHTRLRADWTLLPFFVYGMSITALWFTFDDYAFSEPFKIVAYLVLAVGGWYYLHSEKPVRRFTILFAGITLAMGVAAAGKALLHFWPDYPLTWHFPWTTETLSAVITWGWLVINLSVPLLINLLPTPKTSSLVPGQLTAET